MVYFDQELDDERDREEKKKKKKAAKRRDKNKRKKNKDGEKVDGCGKLNGVIVSNHVDEYDELDEEETKGDNCLRVEIFCPEIAVHVFQYSITFSVFDKDIQFFHFLFFVIIS